jgi:guanine deaminase
MTDEQALVIRGGRLVDIKGHKAEPADVLILGDTVHEVGPPGLAAPAGARVVDAAGKAMIPGLVNAHTHSHSSLSKAVGDRWTLELLLNAGPWVTGRRTAEDMHLSAKLAAVEMVLKGCTAAYDLFSELPAPSAEGWRAVGQAYADVGLRAVVAPMLADRTFYEAVPGLLEAMPPSARARAEKIRMAPHAEALAAARRVLGDWPFDRERVAVAIAPTIPLLCSDAFLAAARRLAEEFGVGFHTHMAESRVWAVAGLKTYNRSLTAHFDDLGILGPRFTAAHAVWLDDDDMRRMAAKGASVAHNPGSNMRLGSGLADVRAMRELGVNVGIGTDSCTCADSLSMIDAMRFASYVSRVTDREPAEWLSTDEVLTMATEGSARALGFTGRIGRIAPGYKADIVFLDLANVAFVPLNDVVNQIVHAAESDAVESVMIGGRMVVAGRRLATLDYDALRAEVERARERALAANADMRKWANALEPIVVAHCSGLARQHPSFRRR